MQLNDTRWQQQLVSGGAAAQPADAGPTRTGDLLLGGVCASFGVA
jgi:hypothetical protein